ncbi:alpha/beta hydrolase [Micromonospora olivasterospora]|uniref:Putative esterase n=1 Tax=Micromonospora olivasterospora TaxID=1880 RepID=A0A562IG69_MICOL|nr:phospholipase [Micromonospora olivasterospora]TWH70011.1 putative esterase [Micromonospora olivasterospora]
MSEPAPAHREPAQDHRHGRLTARPGPPVSRARRGLVTVPGPGGEPAALLYAPAERADDRPYRLVLLLHGAGGSARQGLDLLLPLADAHHLLLVAPKATASTWDVIVEGFGTDVRRIDALLADVFTGYPVARVAFGGFSDGASYALSLGLTNGDLADAVLAFSPGFAAPLVSHGRPRLFLSHGTDDRVLPVDVCSRRLAPRLRDLGHDVTYAEFAGGHEVPEPIRRQALDWLAAG